MASSAALANRSGVSAVKAKVPAPCPPGAVSALPEANIFIPRTGPLPARVLAASSRSDPRKSPTARSVVTPDINSCFAADATSRPSTNFPSGVYTSLSTRSCALPPPMTLLGIPVPNKCACRLMSPGRANLPLMSTPFHPLVSPPCGLIAAILPSSTNISLPAITRQSSVTSTTLQSRYTLFIPSPPPPTRHFFLIITPPPAITTLYSFPRGIALMFCGACVADL